MVVEDGVGNIDGNSVGNLLGSVDGGRVPVIDGLRVGDLVGDPVGNSVGEMKGSVVDTTVGLDVPFVIRQQSAFATILSEPWCVAVQILSVMEYWLICDQDECPLHDVMK